LFFLLFRPGICLRPSLGLDTNLLLFSPLCDASLDSVLPIKFSFGDEEARPAKVPSSSDPYDDSRTPLSMMNYAAGSLSFFEI